MSLLMMVGQKMSKMDHPCLHLRVHFRVKFIEKVEEVKDTGN